MVSENAGRQAAIDREREKERERETITNKKRKEGRKDIEQNTY